MDNIPLDDAILRKKIARYISREMYLSKTPAYSLNADEQAYGIVSLFNKWLEEQGAMTVYIDLKNDTRIDKPLRLRNE